MFGIKKKPNEKHFLVLLDSQKNEILRCDRNEFILPEEIVIQLSIRYFDDEEPCEIHRSAVRKRFLMELLPQLDMAADTAIEKLENIDPKCFPEDAEYIRLL